MAGHSKWKQIQHKKAVMDVRRGRIFSKLLRAIEVAAREKGGNPEANPTLADAIERAKEASVPWENIERAIKRGTGELEGVKYESLTYEGYGPGGVAVMVEVLTDSRNRTSAEIRKVFQRYGGSLGEPGSVVWNFSRKAVVAIPASGVSEEELLAVALEAGAEDVKQEGDSWQVTAEPQALSALRKAFLEAGIPVASAEVAYQPINTVPVSGEEAGKLLRLLGELDEHDDVQAVWSNFEMPDEVLAGLG